MTAKIIETNNTPLKKVEVEGITADIIENALKNARIEMDAVLFRTAMSPGIREQGDCFPMIANKDGKMVVGQFGSFIGPFMEAYNDDIEEGDIILTGFIISKDTYKVSYHRNGGVSKQEYKLTLKNGDQLLKVKTDPKGKFI